MWSLKRSTRNQASANLFMSNSAAQVPFLDLGWPVLAWELSGGFPKWSGIVLRGRRDPAPLVATASLHSSKTTTADRGTGHDPEVPSKLEDVNTRGKQWQRQRKGPSPWEVTLGESEDPKTTGAWYKRATTLTASSGTMCVTYPSSTVGVTRHIRLWLGPARFYF